MTRQHQSEGNRAPPSGAPTTSALPECPGWKQCLQRRSHITRTLFEAETLVALERDSEADGGEAVIDEAGWADCERRIICGSIVKTTREKVETDGYLHTSGSSYMTAEDVADLKKLQESYFRLPADADGGQRYRAYKRYVQAKGQLLEAEHRGYMQTRKLNYTEGGKIRSFEPIEADVSTLALVRKVIAHDTRIMWESGILDRSTSLEVALHQVRYQPTEERPSYSSPPWLHKDDEPVVFVHLVNLSANLTGGDSVLATGLSEFQRVVRLSSPLDTLLLTQKLYHAVTPVGVSSGVVGFRDILIVTFKPAA